QHGSVAPTGWMGLGVEDPASIIDRFLCIVLLSRGLQIVMVGEIIYKLVDGFLDRGCPALIQGSVLKVILCECKAPYRDFVVVRGQRLLLQEFLGVMRRFDRIAGKHPLVKTLLRCQDRAITECNIEELQLWDVPTEHHHARRERRGQQETNRSPKTRPECRCQDNRQG